MNEGSCPVCGEGTLRRETEAAEVRVPFASPVTYQRSLDVCESCGESLVADEDDSEKTIALQSAQKESVVQVLNYLSALGMSNAYLERSLDLPQRTLARWKTNGASAGGMALLRMVRTFPFLTKVGEAQYHSGAADTLLLAEAATRLATAVARMGGAIEAQATANSIELKILGEQAASSVHERLTPSPATQAHSLVTFNFQGEPCR